MQVAFKPGAPEQGDRDAPPPPPSSGYPRLRGCVRGWVASPLGHSHFSLGVSVRRLPFGWSFSPAIFQELTQRLVRNCLGLPGRHTAGIYEQQQAVEGTGSGPAQADTGGVPV